MNVQTDKSADGPLFAEPLCQQSSCAGPSVIDEGSAADTQSSLQRGKFFGERVAQHIQLKVKDQLGREQQFSIAKTAPRHKLMDAFRSRLGFQPSQLWFYFAPCMRILADDTASELGLKNRDLIDAVA